VAGTTFSTANWQYYAEHDGDISSPSGTLTDFPVLIDLAKLHADEPDFGANVQSSGGDIRCTDEDNNVIPFDLIDWDYNSASPLGFLRVKRTLDAGDSTQKIRVWWKYKLGTAVGYDANETYGSENAYPSQFLAHLPTTEGTGTTAFDRTSNSYDGTLNSDVGWSGDKLSFDGSHSGVSIMSAKPLDGGTAFTIMMRANADDISSDRGLFYTANHAGSDPLLFWMDNAATDKIGAIVTTSAGTTGAKYSGTALSASTDYHVALTWDGSTVRLYVNGTEDTTGTLPASIGGTLKASGASSYRIGQSSSVDKSFDGTIDRISILDAALSASWVAHEFSQIDDQDTFLGTWTATDTDGGGPTFLPAWASQRSRVIA
jgi:hypothetical protein